MATRKIAVVVGSLRKESFTRKVAKSIMLLAPPTLEMTIVEIGQLPLYNQDDDNNPAEPVRRFKTEIAQAQGVLFVTPEYNRSVPGVLKNAIDVGSRPYGQSAWSGKPGAVVSASPSGIGGFGANHHLRQSLVFLNVPAMAQPEAYIGGVDKLLGEDGSISNAGTREFMQKFLAAFEQWIEHNRAA